MNETLSTVSVIIPARDAEDSLPKALASIADQTYPNIIEVIVAVADEPTKEVASGRAVIVDNPTGQTPTGLNLAIAAAKGDVIVRCDAHSILPEDYVSRAVATLIRTGAANVGGMQVPAGKTYWQRAVAAAMSSAAGSGDARYRIGGEEGSVETVYLGVFRREVLDELGGFNESFTRAQDYELNHRIIESGGLVWFDPELRVGYAPRSSLRALWRQYLDYGRARRRLSRLHPGSLRPRQVAAPTIVVALAGSLIATVLTAWAWVIPTIYATALLTAGLLSRDKGPPLGTAMALATMHIAWGTGFLRG